MKTPTFKLVESPEMAMAVNGMIRVCREVGLTASEFENAVFLAKRMVHSAAMNADLKGLDVQAEDFEDGKDEDWPY